MLHSICQQIWKTQQWSQDRKRSLFIPISKKGNAKECSNYCTIVLISHASKVKVAQSCPTLCDPMDYTVHGILQARILEWEAVPFSRGSSQPRDQTQISCLAGGFFTIWAIGEAQEYRSGWPILSPEDLPDPGIKLGSLALQADSLPIELPGKPHILAR